MCTGMYDVCMSCIHTCIKCTAGSRTSIKLEYKVQSRVQSMYFSPVPGTIRYSYENMHVIQSWLFEVWGPTSFSYVCHSRLLGFPGTLARLPAHAKNYF